MDLGHNQQAGETKIATTFSGLAKSRSGRPLRSRIGRQMLPGRIRQKKNILQGMTRPLKRWLIKNRTNPYPSKNEKIQLAIGSQMNLTQVSNWFANARRRVKNTVKDSEADWETRIKSYNSFKSGNADRLSSDSSSSGSCSDDSCADSTEEPDGTTKVTDDHCYSAPDIMAAHSSLDTPKINSNVPIKLTSPSPDVIQTVDSNCSTSSSSTQHQIQHTRHNRHILFQQQQQQHRRQQLDAEHVALSDYLARRGQKRARESSDDDDEDADDDVDKAIASDNNNNESVEVKSNSNLICDRSFTKSRKYKKRMTIRFLSESHHVTLDDQQEKFDQWPVSNPGKQTTAGRDSVESGSEANEQSQSTSQSPTSTDSNMNQSYQAYAPAPVFHRRIMHPSQSLRNEQQWDKLDAAIVLASLGEITSKTVEEKTSTKLKCWNHPEKKLISNKSKKRQTQR